MGILRLMEPASKAQNVLSDRQTEKEAIAVANAEVYAPKDFGRIRLQQGPDISGDSLIEFIRQVVSPGSAILTNGWKKRERSRLHGWYLQKSCCQDQGILLI